MKNKIEELVIEMLTVEEKQTGKEKMEVYENIENKVKKIINSKLNEHKKKLGELT